MASPNPFSGDPDRDRRNFSLLMEAVADLFGPRGFDELLCKAVDRAVLVTEAELGILLLDDGCGMIPHVVRDRAGNDLPLEERHSRTVVRNVCKTQEPYRTVDVADPSADPVGESAWDLRLLSIMATPLMVKDKLLGVLYVHSTRRTKEFTHADFSLFSVLGGVVATAVINARLRSEAEHKERLERQLSFAHEVQQGLLPGEPSPPAGYDLAGEGRPCEQISGDYYDVIDMPDGRVMLVVGDVSGHGIGPALHMASTRALIRQMIEEGRDAPTIVDALNRALARDMASSEFMSLFLGVLEPEPRTFSFSNAGHNPPILVRADGGAETLDGTGPLLSVFESADYSRSSLVTLHSGDGLALYTDGIYESRDRGGEMYGEERFRASLEAHLRAGASAAEVVKGVLEDLDRFCSERPLEDDVTLLVLRVL